MSKKLLSGAWENLHPGRLFLEPARQSTTTSQGRPEDTHIQFDKCHSLAFLNT